MLVTLEDSCRTIGIISDTHGLFRPDLRELFADVDHILHAGDIGRPPILRDLAAIAPVTAVLGNVDIPNWFPELPLDVIVEVGNHRIIMLHDLNRLDLDPGAAEIDIVVFGHSHKPYSRRKKGVWYINPGSAGPRRFMIPVSVAVLSLENEISVRHHTVR
jgi:uncharacterized protein